MDEILQRLDQVIELYGSNKTAFARKIGMAQSTLTSIYQRNNGKAILSMAESALEIYADVRPEWLMHGEEPMLRSQLRNEGIDKLIDIITDLSATIRAQQETISNLTKQ